MTDTTALPALLARMIAEGAHHARAATLALAEETARVHEGATVEAHMAAVYVADLIAEGRMRDPGYVPRPEVETAARCVADDLSSHPAARSDAISAAIYGGASADPVITVSEAEAHASAGRSLAALGLTYTELEDQARRGDFTSPRAQALWTAIGGTIDPGRLAPAPAAGLRNQIARAIHRYDYEHGLSGNDMPSEHHRGEAAAVLAVIQDQFVPPPPGSTAEQLPDDILALIDPPPYLSTACETAQLLEQATAEHPDRQAGLGEWARRMHDRCRINQKYTGKLCTCAHHGAA